MNTAVTVIVVLLGVVVVYEIAIKPAAPAGLFGTNFTLGSALSGLFSGSGNAGRTTIPNSSSSGNSSSSSSSSDVGDFFS